MPDFCNSQPVTAPSHLLPSPFTPGDIKCLSKQMLLHPQYQEMVDQPVTAEGVGDDLCRWLTYDTFLPSAKKAWCFRVRILSPL